MPRTVSIENATLKHLAASPAAVARLPHLLGTLSNLARSHATPSGCGTCEGRRAREMAQALALTKRAITGMSAEDRQALKALLGADDASVLIADAAGRVTPYTF